MSSSISKSERILLWVTAIVALALRAVAFFNYRFDSDEQQHLHVTWGWTAGLVQYRDYFDNHVPLFHLATAPLLAVLGERSNILHWMRAPMLLLFAAILWCTYLIGRRLYDERVGVWAAAVLALFPPFFLKSLEYRTDTLWTALVIAAIALLVHQRSMFLTGLLLGSAMATSAKTTVVLIAIGAAMLIAKFFAKWSLPKGWLRFAAGFAIVPAALAVFFAAAGAWDELVYCTVTFNGNVYLTRRYLWVGRVIFPFAAATLLYAAWRWKSNSWRYVLAVAMGVFTVTIGGFWALISPRDFLPLMPLAAIFAASVMSLRAFAATTMVFVVSLWYYTDGFENRTAWHTTMLDQVLRLTRPGEPLIDHKGETIYRPRPFYFVFENITRAQMARGIIRDTVAEDVIRTRTYVAQADGAMWPPRARAFLNANFVDMGRIRAAGQWIREDGTFTIAIPGPYVILDARGEAAGILDGTPYRGARELAAGPHRFEGEKQVVVVWAPAFQRGHSPFHLRDREF